jgi:hypothetical protein
MFAASLGARLIQFERGMLAHEQLNAVLATFKPCKTNYLSTER